MGIWEDTKEAYGIEEAAEIECFDDPAVPEECEDCSYAMGLSSGRSYCMFNDRYI